MDNNGIILRISELMKYLKMKPAQFADSINMDRSGFSKRMNGRTATGIGVLNKIVLAHNTSIKWLLTGDGPIFLSRNKAYEENLNQLEEPINLYPTKSKKNNIMKTIEDLTNDMKILKNLMSHLIDDVEELRSAQQNEHPKKGNQATS